MTLPTINETRPTEPPSFSALAQINGTILFEWGRPIVQPVGTEFQLIRSTNSGNAAVGTVVWQGDAYSVPLVMPTSPHWYWVRAVANSSFSPYMPNTFGITEHAFWNRNPAGEDFAFPDGEFTLTKAGSAFWSGAFHTVSEPWSLDTSSGFTASRGSIVLVSTTGFTSGNQQTIEPGVNPSVFASFLRSGRLDLRVIRESSGTADFTFGVSARNYTNKTTFTNMTILAETRCFVSSLNVGVWTDYSFAVSAVNSPFNRIYAFMNWYSNFGTDGRTRVGRFQLTMEGAS